MLFSAVKSLGEIEIQKEDGTVVKYTIKPFDYRVMKQVSELGKDKDADRADELSKQISIFCPEYNADDLNGIPINTLTEMVEYIIETSQGQKRDKDEKKTPSTKPIKP